jgi:hypothetical protein
MPRAALLSIHARVRGTGPSTWEDASLVQLWGPRFSTYVVPARDRAVFTLGRLPDDARGRGLAEDVPARLHAFLAGRRMTDREAGIGLGENPFRFRYAAPTGTVLIRWEADAVRLGSCPAATRTSFSTASIASSWSPMPPAVSSCGPRVCGRARCSSRGRSSAPGDVRRRT